jgi:exopolysaccharide biosynthesis polyprenyl glycosylphosphotransferase
MNARALLSRASILAPLARAERAADNHPTRVAASSATEAFATSSGPWTSAWALVALADALSAFAVFGLVSFTIASPASGTSERLGFLGLCWGALTATLWARRAYRRVRRQIAPAPADEIGSLVTGIVAGAWVALGSVAIIQAMGGPTLPVVRVVIGFAACALTLPLIRAGALAVHSRVASTQSRIVVLGTGTIAADVAARLTRSRHVSLVGFVDDDPHPGQPVLGDLAALPSICALESVDRVVVAFSRSHPQATMDTLRSLAGTVAIDVVPRYFELTGWEADLIDLEGLAVISLDGGPPGPVARAIKRTFDMIGAGVGLLLLAPALLAAAAAIKISSPGPVLFRQERLGRNRAPFSVLKLRTMRPASAEELAADEARLVPRPLFDHPLHERRVTRVGRLLRRSGLDELPQLLNVLRGDMSLVGPRPFVPQECGALPDWVDRRFAIRPGLTGLWQVCGQHDLRFEELCRLDCQYVNTWSFKGDVRILARTPGRLLRGGGGEGRWR